MLNLYYNKIFPPILTPVSHTGQEKVIGLEIPIFFHFHSKKILFCTFYSSISGFVDIYLIFIFIFSPFKKLDFVLEKEGRKSQQWKKKWRKKSWSSRKNLVNGVLQLLLFNPKLPNPELLPINLQSVLTGYLFFHLLGLFHKPGYWRGGLFQGQKILQNKTS